MPETAPFIGNLSSETYDGMYERWADMSRFADNVFENEKTVAADIAKSIIAIRLARRKEDTVEGNPPLIKFAC